MSRKRRQLGGIDRLRSGRWRARVSDPATGQRTSIGTFASKADAEAAVARAITDQQRGGWVSPATSRTTLAEYAATWVGSRVTAAGTPLRPRVRELYESQLKLHILPALGSVQLGRLRPSTVRTWYSGLLADGLGQSTAAKCYRLLRAMMNTAVEDGLLAANPCTIKGAGAEKAPERPIPRISEVYELADAVPERLRALVLLAAFGGLRKGELLGLRRRHVDVEGCAVTVAEQRQQLSRGGQLIGEPKSSAGKRTVAIPAEVAEPLAEHLERWAQPGEDGWVFTGEKGGPLSPVSLQAEWDRARRSVGLRELHLHDLRHVAGTLSAATGAGVKEIMHRLGHSSPDAALRYQHATKSRDRAIADAISEDIRTTLLLERGEGR